MGTPSLVILSLLHLTGSHLTKPEWRVRMAVWETKLMVGPKRFACVLLNHNTISFPKMVRKQKYKSSTSQSSPANHLESADVRVILGMCFRIKPNRLRDARLEN